jgi:hypothetical protein
LLHDIHPGDVTVAVHILDQHGEVERVGARVHFEGNAHAVVLARHPTEKKTKHAIVKFMSVISFNTIVSSKKKTDEWYLLYWILRIPAAQSRSAMPPKAVPLMSK